MVTRRRLRTFLNVLALYAMAALLIGYFGINAYTGNRGLKAQQNLELERTRLNKQLVQLSAERARWERRIRLLEPDRIDPDMLDQRARTLLEYAHPNDLTLLLKPN